MAKHTSVHWTTKELNIMNEHGSTMTTKELMKLLPNRTADAIRGKNSALGIQQTADTRQRMLNTRKSNSLVYGVGINDLADDAVYVTVKYDHSSGKKKIVWKCPFYAKWTGMLHRCYGSNAPAYKDCTVSEEWHRFSVFKKWMESQSWQGKEIDKDILVPGNKVYGKEFCLFVSKHLNNLLHTNENIRGEYPLGVSFVPRSTTSTNYHARQTKYGKDCHIGYFDTVEEAALAYECVRREYIQEVADNLTEDDTSNVDATRDALLNLISP